MARKKSAPAKEEAAGGSEPRVTHVRCALEGDAFCEWELTWKAGPVASD
jgi:hypothetical protein